MAPPQMTEERDPQSWPTMDVSFCRQEQIIIRLELMSSRSVSSCLPCCVCVMCVKPDNRYVYETNQTNLLISLIKTELSAGAGQRYSKTNYWRLQFHAEEPSLKLYGEENTMWTEFVGFYSYITNDLMTLDTTVINSDILSLFIGCFLTRINIIPMVLMLKKYWHLIVKLAACKKIVGRVMQQAHTVKVKRQWIHRWCIFNDNNRPATEWILTLDVRPFTIQKEQKKVLK